MGINAKYVHTNIVAKDWRRLVQFYVDVFDCEPIGSERNYRGQWVSRVTAIADVSLEGVHLRLPGYGADGPTLEIFTYSRQPARPSIQVNQPGFAHIAFHVDDVRAASEVVLAAGGNSLGELHSMEVPGAGNITFRYMTDPEGNVIELQNWQIPRE